MPFRVLIPSAVCAAVAGCVGESMRNVELRRESDGARATCMSNVYAVYPLLPSPSEREAKRSVAGCVDACIRDGFSIEGRFPPSGSFNDAEHDPSAAEKCAVITRR